MANGIEYIAELQKAYEQNGGKKVWDRMMEVSNGISDEDKKALLEVFPECPEALIEMLEKIDGTYHRVYGDERITEYFLGSDVGDGEYPYYLFSAQQIIKNKASILDLEDIFYYAVNDPDEEWGPFLDERLQSDTQKLNWLHFSDCMNNGGTSTLYVDFTPSEKGKKGQIVRYLHDPDSFKVIADSFEEYLDMIIKSGFKFIYEDDFSK